MFELSHVAEVEATADDVWRTLLDFEHYAAWTRALRIRGQAEVGGAVDYTPTHRRAGRAHPLILHCFVTVVEPSRKLVWVTGLPWIMNFEFAFELEPRGARVVVRHRVRVSGLGTFLARWRMAALMSPTFERFMDDLGRRCARRR